MVIAIDGPAGAGKSTVAALSRRSWASRTSTRAPCTARSRSSLLRDPNGTAAERAREVEIDFHDPALRTPEVSEAASRVATDPDVRAALVDRQRELMKSGDWVAEGRDIGTVVAPHAELKVFLTASPEERARRRAEELGADVETVLRDQALRDETDRSREHSPLEAAPDSVEVDTTGLTIDEVVARIGELARERR